MTMTTTGKVTNITNIENLDCAYKMTNQLNEMTPWYNDSMIIIEPMIDYYTGFKFVQ